jgi:hypothetical protein
LLYPKPPKCWLFRLPEAGNRSTNHRRYTGRDSGNGEALLDGKIREWYSRGDGKGVIFLVDAKTEDEARAIMESLPLAEEQLMETKYIPVGPLMPLRALLGPGAQQQ